MPSAAELSNAISGIFENMFAGSSQKYLIYIGWFVWAIVILAIGFVIYYWIMYKYKIIIMEGSIEKGENGKEIVNVRKIRKDRAMPIKDKGIPKWRLLFTWNKKIEPIDFKYILPNNYVFLCRTGPDTFNPMPRPVITNPSAVFSVDPFDRAFLNLGVQNDAREYMKDDAVRKAQVWMFVSGIIILIAIVVSGWLILKYSAGTAEKIDFATAGLDAVKNAMSGIAPK